MGEALISPKLGLAKGILIDGKVSEDVFGSLHSPGYRKPNGKVDVLLGLWEARRVLW